MASSKARARIGGASGQGVENKGRARERRTSGPSHPGGHEVRRKVKDTEIPEGKGRV